MVRAGTLGLPLALAIIGGEPARFAPLFDLYRRRPSAPGTTRRRSPPPQRAWLHRRDDRGGGRRFLRAAGRGDEPDRPRARLGTDEPGAFRPVARSPRGALFVGDPARRWPKRSSPRTEIFRNDRFLLQMAIGLMPHDKIMEAIELYGTKVAPIVRKALS